MTPALYPSAFGDIVLPENGPPPESVLILTDGKAYAYDMQTGGYREVARADYVAGAA